MALFAWAILTVCSRRTAAMAPLASSNWLEIMLNPGVGEAGGLKWTAHWMSPVLGVAGLFGGEVAMSRPGEGAGEATVRSMAVSPRVEAGDAERYTVLVGELHRCMVADGESHCAGALEVHGGGPGDNRWEGAGSFGERGWWRVLLGGESFCEVSIHRWAASVAAPPPACRSACSALRFEELKCGVTGKGIPGLTPSGCHDRVLSGLPL